jgi:hypothetical protein
LGATGVTSIDVSINGINLGNNLELQGLLVISDATDGQDDVLAGTGPNLSVNFNLDQAANTTTGQQFPIVVDVFGFGFIDDGAEAAERISNQIVRFELEETGENTSTFEGSLEYTMVNQLNILDLDTYTGISPIADDPTFIVIEDLTDEDAPRVNYHDLGADGISTQVSDQEEAPSHSGVVSFDNDSYKIADTVTITLEDADLNVDNDLIDIFTVVSEETDPAFDTVGADLADDLVFSFGPLGRLLDVTFDDQQWRTSYTGCVPTGGADTGLGNSGFSLIETDPSSGIFVGDFQIPSNWCRPGAENPETTTGLDIEVNYVDFRDSSGEIIEVGDSAGIRSVQSKEFDKIRGESIDLIDSDGTIIIPENLEIYFPTNNQIRERIEDLKNRGIDLSGLFKELESVDEKNNSLILTKTTIVTITNAEDYKRIFGSKGIIDGTITLDNGQREIIIDEQFLLEKINKLKDVCSQNANLYCDKTDQELKNLILDKIGTHTIIETLKLEKISTIPSSIQIDTNNPFGKVIPTNFELSKKHNESIQTIFDLDSHKKHYEIFLEAYAQGDPYRKIGENSYQLSFLNGFTLGFGYERDWSYEYNLLEMIPIYAEMHAEAGLGIGLRIPIDIQLDFESLDPQNQLSINYSGKTKDIHSAGYRSLGVGELQIFGGKEFNSYLGPRLDLLIKVFDEIIYEKNESLIPIDKLPGNNFEPPLGGQPEEITRYELPCEKFRTCITTPVASGGFYPGMRANLEGEKISFNSLLKKPVNQNNKISIFNNNEERYFSYQIENNYDSTINSYKSIPIDLLIYDVEYFSAPDLIPMVKLSMTLNSWIFPLEIGTGWVDLPSIKIENMIFNSHEGTVDKFNVKDFTESEVDNSLKIPAPFVDPNTNPQRYVDRYNNEPSYKKWFDDNYPEYDSIYQAVGLEEPQAKPETKPKPVCGEGTELVNGVCQVIKEEEQEGGGCLIATAAYDSELASQVQFLREIRDNTVMSTESGSAFMTGFNQLYYAFSPTIADMERQNPIFQETVRLFITPMLSTLSIMTLAENGNEAEVLGLGISVIALNLGMYIAAPAVFAWKIHRNLKSRK